MPEISDYAAVTDVQADDLLAVVDVHDTSMAGSGTTKRMTVSQLPFIASALAGADGGVATLDGSGHVPAAQVTVTNLAAPLPAAQGGTGQASLQAAIDALTGSQSAGHFLRSDGTHATLQPISAGDLPAATPTTRGAVPLDGSAGLFPWQFRPESYGAAGDGKVLYDAAITASSSALTSASAGFSPSVTGMTILVNGAGAGGLPLVATMTYASATQVTLSAAASATVSGALACYGTDDTAAINSAVAAAVAYAASSGGQTAEVLFRPAIYMLAGALTQGGATKGNAQIPLPVVSLASGHPATINLTLTGARGGGAGPSMYGTISGSAPAPAVDGTVLFSTLLGQSYSGTFGAPSVLGGPTPEQGDGGGFSQAQWNNLSLTVDAITILTPVIPTIGGMDLRSCVKVIMPAARVQAFDYFEDLANFNPDPGQSVGLYTPSAENLQTTVIGTFTALGFFVGISPGSAFTAQELTVAYCTTALAPRADNGQGGIVITRMWCGECNVYVYGPGTGGDDGPQTLTILGLFAEANQDQWGDGSPWLIYDPGSMLSGLIRLNTQTAASAVAALVNGASNLEILYDGGGATAVRGHMTSPALPSPGGSIVNPFWRHCMVTVSGGSAVNVTIDGQATGLASGPFRVASGKSIGLGSYTGTPAWNWWAD